MCLLSQSVSQFLTRVIFLTRAGNTSGLIEHIWSFEQRLSVWALSSCAFLSAMLSGRMTTQNYVKGCAQNFGFQNVILDGFVPKYPWKFHYCVNFQVEGSPL